MVRNFPRLVAQLTTNHDAWIVGGACISDTPKDYDVVVPLHRWAAAACLLYGHDTYEINTFGGLKINEGGVEIDVWPDEIGRMMTNVHSKHFWHPRSGARWTRTD